jgi:hypothetical protein
VGHLKVWDETLASIDQFFSATCNSTAIRVDDLIYSTLHQMGALASLFSRQDKDSVDVFIDFENAVPTGEEEIRIYQEVAQVLDKSASIVEKLKTYTTRFKCEEAIRKAISSPSPESEKAAWEVLLPAVEQLYEFYEFSLELERVFPQLLVALCNENASQSIKTQQALAKQLADVFDFVLRFDDCKMVTPGIQNDFSYYRRTLNRMKLSKEEASAIKIRDELANRMSLFFAYPTPMMRALSETTVKCLDNHNGMTKNSVIHGLAMMANICQDMVEKRKFTSVVTNMFCLRAMTGCIILVDSINEQGAFYRKSPINIKGCVMALKNYTEAPTDGLLNALKFSKHLNDPDTPHSIKALLQ